MENTNFTDVQSAFIKNITVKGFSSETIRSYKRDLDLFNKYLTRALNRSVYLEEVSVDDLENYLQFLAEEKGLKASSRNRYFASVSSMFHYALKKELIEKNPCDFIESAKVVESPKVTLDEDEIKQLLQAIDKPILRFAVLFLSKTGLRVSEMKNLTLSAVDLKSNKIHLFNTKGGKYRQIPIATTLRPHILTYLKNVRKSESEFFFATEKTGRLSSQYLNFELKKACRKLGWDRNITNHSIRRSFATNLLNRGANISTIQRLLGHASLKTTSIYLNIVTADLEAAVDLLDKEE
ncbi:tyrosine-type recombinase/integrase [Sporosarcina sp. FSL W7-1283]|uniref:tyrosine-type recombinase/integrase n=1 Tax=Sporosarcina sp. FSL W7-1283 TaxID=2921560 RepID=UPI0030FAE496